LVEVQVKSIVNFVSGPWSDIVSDTLADNSTGATAGTPGVWTPPGSRIPGDLAEVISLGIVADPLTTWTIGQGVVTQDVNTTHWDGADWIIGNAP
jgi:hypothetical protein